MCQRSSADRLWPEACSRLQWNSTQVPAGRRSAPAAARIFSTSIMSLLRHRPELVRGVLVVVRLDAAALVAARHDVERAVHLGRVGHHHRERAHVRPRAAVALPRAVVLVPHPHRALDRRLGVDLRVIDVDVVVPAPAASARARAAYAPARGMAAERVAPSSSCTRKIERTPPVCSRITVSALIAERRPVSARSTAISAAVKSDGKIR